MLGLIFRVRLILGVEVEVGLIMFLPLKLEMIYKCAYVSSVDSSVHLYLILLFLIFTLVYLYKVRIRSSISVLNIYYLFILEA